jgi:pyridoxamine 5'-phosphate oxidase
MKNHINSFSEACIDYNPFVQFSIWFNERPLSLIKEPYAAALATTGNDGRISQRIVLVKEFDETGFRFFTNYNSLKGLQLESNPSCAILFYWPESGRQVRIEGNALKVPAERSQTYFKTRPRESQISSWASQQSAVIPSREFLQKKFDMYKNMFYNMPVEKPEHWGGFCLVPNWFEFWQEGDFRLHDRIIYLKRDDIWVTERLAP